MLAWLIKNNKDVICLSKHYSFLSFLLVHFISFSLKADDVKLTVLQDKTWHQIQYIHQMIDKVHPAVIEDEAVEFKAWHQQALVKTKNLLSHVKNRQDAQALVRYFITNYQDPHVWAEIKFTGNKSKKSSILGWIYYTT